MAFGRRWVYTVTPRLPPETQTNSEQQSSLEFFAQRGASSSGTRQILLPHLTNATHIPKLRRDGGTSMNHSYWTMRGSLRSALKRFYKTCASAIKIRDNEMYVHSLLSIPMQPLILLQKVTLLPHNCKSLHGRSPDSTV